MKIYKIKKNTWTLATGAGILLIVLINSCAESRKVADKTGVQLWSENCRRCHNPPASNTFSHEQWVMIGMHMQTRAQLTDKERDKIIAFLQQ
ncbi:cytochrome c [Chitinophaga sp. HK235]|uniref:c-type cytochrome n=1 Tax=Chitinophaga sp. HK235 TaxID=2952571 RepID=UPI001BA6BE8F|nr:cytochrome c [Chitinophaga sp. HK235]